MASRLRSQAIRLDSAHAPRAPRVSCRLPRLAFRPSSRLGGRCHGEGALQPSVELSSAGQRRHGTHGRIARVTRGVTRVSCRITIRHGRALEGAIEGAKSAPDQSSVRVANLQRRGDGIRVRRCDAAAHRCRSGSATPSDALLDSITPPSYGRPRRTFCMLRRRSDNGRAAQSAFRTPPRRRRTRRRTRHT